MSEAWQKLMQQMMEQSQQMAARLQPGAGDLPRQGVRGSGADHVQGFHGDGFGRTFNREGLDAKTRMLVTIGALTVLGAQAEPQLKLSIRHALEAGATKREIAETIWQMSMFGGLPAMQKALEIAQGVFGEKGEDEA
jgi:4-carboxymuconolactone decarboxylase